MPNGQFQTDMQSQRITVHVAISRHATKLFEKIQNILVQLGQSKAHKKFLCTHKRVFDGTADVPIVLFCLYFNFFGRPLICFVHVPEPRTYAEPWTVMNSFVLRPRFEYPNPPTHACLWCKSRTIHCPSFIYTLTFLHHLLLVLYTFVNRGHLC